MCHNKLCPKIQGIKRCLNGFRSPTVILTKCTLKMMNYYLYCHNVVQKLEQEIRILGPWFRCHALMHCPEQCYFPESKPTSLGGEGGNIQAS